MPRYRWELHDGAKHKFLDASIEGKSLFITEGKLGTNGRQRVKACSSPSSAEMELMILASGRLRREGWTVAKVTKKPASARPKPEPKAKPAPKAALDWKSIEDKLVTAATARLAKFATTHGDETFYGAIFLVETFDGVFVRLALNTPEHLLEEAGPVNAKKLHYKWLPGGFQYDVAVSKHVAGWNRIDAAIVEHTQLDMDDDTTVADGMWKTSGALVDCVCRVALRLEPTFAKLKRTADFGIAVSADADEPGDLALARMTRFRKRRARAR